MHVPTQLQIRRRQIASIPWKRRHSNRMESETTLAKYRSALVSARKPIGFLKTTNYLVVNNNPHGGSNKWVNDLRTRLLISTPLVRSVSQLTEQVKRLSLLYRLTVVVSSLLWTDISIDSLLSLQDHYKFKIVIPVHDWHWFNLNTNNPLANHSLYLESWAAIPSNTGRLFARCHEIRCPSLFVYNFILKFYNSPTLTCAGWHDYSQSEHRPVNVSEDEEIRLGVLTKASEYKGSEQVNYLVANSPGVVILRVGVDIPEYDDTLDAFYKTVRRYGIAGLIYLNKWGETWSYALTKGLVSGLPIFYNNIGCFRNRIPKNVPKYVINNNSESEYYDFESLSTNFAKFVDFLKKRRGL